MKLLLLTMFVATICYVNAGKKHLLAALNAGLMAGMNRGMMAGVNGGMANGAIPGMLVGGLNAPMVAGGGAGVLGQPQFAQFVPGLRAFAVPAPVPNLYPVPVLPLLGLPQTAPMNPPQQPLLGNVGGAVQQQQQLPPQLDPLRRFRRQTEKQDGTFKTTVDTQIPAPTEAMATAPCGREGRHEYD
ncbi:secretory calcium-binding phosphoprotein 9 [Chelmon rostratus]|uniref:secretory calcium-binding phosphoprotein 9 n=1 Tax=Chelmon rostratus TaxID=109905 RepID=UPI001BE85B24|nr:secretory calcium-binding phosphoprotein 9 [Chelmon rostratus]